MSERQEKSSYHHGALRDELMTACLALIRDEGIGSVSLRRVARVAGVSPGAPYHHFTDRSELLGALSVQGFGLLAERMRAAYAAAESPEGAMGALTEAYVNFARREPAYFLLMFRPELTGADKHHTVKAAADDALTVLLEAVGDYVASGKSRDLAPTSIVAMVWSVAHGLAALCVDGPLEEGGGKLPGVTIDDLVTDVARTVEALLADRPGQTGL